MAVQKIQLSDIEDGSTLNSKFHESDTILDLRKRFAKAQGMDLEDVTFYQTILKLEDEKMVRDLAKTVEGISYGSTYLLEVHLDSVDDDWIWVTRNGKWNRLVKTQQGMFFDVGKKRHLLNGGYAKFAIVISR